MQTITDIRIKFLRAYENRSFVRDKSGSSVIELIGETFKCTDDTIFGAVNHNYIKHEIEWYCNESRCVYDIPGGPPKIWEQVADKNGIINSNYGWCIYSEENFCQLHEVFKTLRTDANSRRAIAIYTRPSMQIDYNSNGMSDFICTNTVQYLIRNDKLHVIVNMRSNDAWAGFRNDYAWQLYVQKELLDILQLEYPHLKLGDIIWQTGSLHLYDRQFYLLDYFDKTGKVRITKKEYNEQMASKIS